MKRFFTVGFFLLLQHICIASDGNKSESEFELPKKHKITLETGEIIYGYQSLKEFKREHVTKLLAERLDILCNLMKSYNRGETKDLNYYKDNLDVNDIVLVNNATHEELEKIFGKTYNSQNISIDHIIQVATYLEMRISKEEADEGKLRDLIVRCEALKKERNIDVYRGKSELVSAQPQSSQSNSGKGLPSISQTHTTLVH